VRESPYWVGWSAGSWGESWGAVPVEEHPELVPAGHWKHLFRPIRAADTVEVVVKGSTRFSVELPETFDLRQAADAPCASCRCSSGFSTLPPVVGTTSTHVRVRGVCRTHTRRPKCAASAPFIRSQAYTLAYSDRPSGGCVATHTSRRGNTYYSLYTPATVQNPTDEMLLYLLAA
jgi:hypothetical protein